MVVLLVRFPSANDAHHRRTARDDDKDDAIGPLEVNAVGIFGNHVRDHLLYVRLVQVHRRAVFLVVHTERGERR